MKYLKSYKMFESRFLEFREVVSTIKDICQEFEDNNCHCDIEPKDDIQLNLVSLKSRGHISSIKQKFYLDIDIDRRICFDDKRSGLGPFPEWFIETCKRIEDYMSDNGFKTLPSVKYPTDWENFESVDELNYAIGLINQVRLDFIPTAKPLDENLSYNADWKKHDSPVRAELEKDLNDILLEVKDLGFRSHISGWTDGTNHPYVWIKATSKTPTPMVEHTRDVVERIKDYLSQKEYQTKVDTLNDDKSSMQIYIYFDIEHLRESKEDLDYNLIEDVKDILLPFSDMGMKVSCDYTSKGDSIALNVMTSKEKAFDINDYKDDIDRLLSYMKDNEWGIWDFKVGAVEKKEDWSGTQLLARNQDILSYKNGPLQYDKVKNPVFWITAEFVKIVYTKVKSVK